MASDNVYADWRVVEACDGFGVATLAGKLLADLGCPVTKLEPPEGDPLRSQESGAHASALFQLVSGSKDSVAIRTASTLAREPLRGILMRADVLIVDQTGLARLRDAFGASDIHAEFPQLTICVCTPFGFDGPLSSWSANEEIVQAMSGILSTTGHADAPPTRIVSATVTHTTAMFAVSSVLADMMRKRDNGRGALLDIGMFDAALALLTAALPVYFLEGVAPRGIGNRHTMAAPWNSFRCADGWAIICAGNDPTWNRLCETIGRRDLLTNPLYVTQESRVRNVDALEMEITAWTQARTVDQVESVMDRHGIPCGSIHSLEQVLAHRQFVERGLIRNCDGASIAGAVFRRNCALLPIKAGASALGAGARTLPRNFDIDPSDIERWIADGILIEHRREINAATAA